MTTEPEKLSEISKQDGEHQDKLPFPSTLTDTISRSGESAAQTEMDGIDELPSSSEDIEQLLFDAQIANSAVNRDNPIAQEKEQRDYAELVLDNYKKTADLAAKYSTISDTRQADLLQDKKGWKRDVKLFILAWALIHAGGAGVYFYVSAQNKKLASAEQSFSQCMTQLETESFGVAKKSCETALQQSKSVKIVGRVRTTGLIAKIQEILHSEKLQQGLDGNILVDGQYLTKTDAEIVFQYKKLRSEGKDLFERSQWTAASKKLQKAIDIGNNNSIIDPATLPDLTSKLQTAQLQTLIQIATEKQSQKSWKKAITSYAEALIYLKELPPQIQQQYNREQLQNSLAKSKFEDIKQGAETLFAKSEWQDAASAYQHALTLGRTNDNIHPLTLSEISLNIERAKLYQAIKSGNQAFASGSWDEAIRAYKSGQSLLADNKAIFTQIDSDVNIRKLTKIILQASIMQNHQTAKKYIAENNLQAAKFQHEEVIRDIKINSFADDRDFLKIITESTEIIQSLEQEIFLNEKQNYLEANFQTLFVKHYPSTSPENLSHPVVTLEKESPENLFFKLQCTEVGRGRRTLLIIHYKYDKKSKTWEFSSGNQKKQKLALTGNRSYQKSKFPFS